MKKSKNLKNYILISISIFLIVSCEAQLITPSPTPSTNAAKVSPSPTPTSYIKSVSFANRKESYTFLKCLIGVDGGNGKENLLERDIDIMEKANPPIPDKTAMESYTNYVNNILRIYPSFFSGCKDLPHKDL